MDQYPPFANYDAEVGYDRKRTVFAPSGDKLGWIEYCRDQDEQAKGKPGGDMSHLQPRMTDAERLPVEAYLHTARDSLSAAPGETVTIHATSRVGVLRLRVYREGRRDGECLLETTFEASWQAIRPQAWWTGAGWPASATFSVPADWASGAYRLEFSSAAAQQTRAPVLHKLVVGAAGTGTDEDFVYSALLIVRSATPATNSPVLFKLSTNSYYAYNHWGGHSLYGFHSFPSWGGTADGASASGDDTAAAVDGGGSGGGGVDYTTKMISEGGLQSHRVSPYRPGHGYYGSIEGRFLTWERLFLLWAEDNGIPLEFCGDADAEDVAFLNAYKMVVSVGHDEYYSAAERLALEQYADGGGNIAFFAGNLATWQVRHESDPNCDTGEGSREAEGYPFVAAAAAAAPGGVVEVEGGQFMVCYKQYHKRQPTQTLTDPRHCTGFSQHPVVTGNNPINTLTGLGASGGGYHRSHGQLLNDSGGYTLLNQESWLTEGLDLLAGCILGSLDSVVGYETDGCARCVDDVTKQVVPTGGDGTPLSFVIVAQALSASGGPGGQWGLEFQAAIPSMELFEGEAMAMAIESGVVKNAEEVHAGYPTLGYYQRDAAGGGLIVNAGVTDWAYGLRRDNVIQGITLNVMRKLSGNASLGGNGGGGGSTTTTTVKHPDGTVVSVVTTGGSSL